MVAINDDHAGRRGSGRSEMLQRCLRLLVTVRQRPQEFCKTVGELEAMIRLLYEVCAFSERKGDLYFEELGRLLAGRGLSDAHELISDVERGRHACRDDSAVQRLVAFWSELDKPLSFPSPPRRSHG